LFTSAVRILFARLTSACIFVPDDKPLDPAIYEASAPPDAYAVCGVLLLQPKPVEITQLPTTCRVAVGDGMVEPDTPVPPILTDPFSIHIQNTALVGNVPFCVPSLVQKPIALLAACPP